MLFLRGGIRKEFAFKTFFRTGCQMLMIDVPTSKELPMADYQYVIGDIYAEDEMYEMALKAKKEIGFDGLCTFMTSPLKVVGKLSDEFGFNYFSEQDAKILANKYEVRKRLEQAKLQKLRYAKIISFEELEKEIVNFNYPVILKPTDNASSRGVIKIESTSGLAEAYELASAESHNGELLLEDYIAGDEYCSEIFVYNEIPYVVLISKKIVSKDKFCVELVDIMPAPLSDSKMNEIKEYLTEAVKQFHIKNWLLHVEFKISDNNDINIIEINTRAAGGKLVESIYHLHGINIYELYYSMLLNRKLDTNILKDICLRNRDNFAAYNTFITPKREGRIKKITGISEVRKSLREKEEFELFYKEGELLPKVTSNLGFKGSFYIFDHNYHELIERVKLLEGMINFEME